MDVITTPFDHSRQRQSNRGIPPSPTGSVPRSWRKFTYKNMAIAMSVLDGALYRSILPCDYLCMDSSASIRAVHKHNRRLTRWVQFCILGKKETSSTVESRVEAVEYFVNTAKVSLYFRLCLSPFTDPHLSGMSETSRFLCCGCHCISDTVPGDRVSRRHKATAFA